MDLIDKKIVDDAIKEYGDDFWNSYAESHYSIGSNREGIVDDIIKMLKQAGYEFVVKPL